MQTLPDADPPYGLTPSGCWSCDLWCMLGSQPPPFLNRMTNTSKNITLPQTSFAGDNYVKLWRHLHHAPQISFCQSRWALWPILPPSCPSPLARCSTLEYTLTFGLRVNTPSYQTSCCRPWCSEEGVALKRIEFIERLLNGSKNRGGCSTQRWI